MGLGLSATGLTVNGSRSEYVSVNALAVGAHMLATLT
jgi:hypothetical protein